MIELQKLLDEIEDACRLENPDVFLPYNWQERKLPKEEYGKKERRESILSFIANESSLGVSEKTLAVGLWQKGGGEGEGENCESVFKFKGVFYMLRYKYFSNHGSDFGWSTVEIVKPVQKTITVYEAE